ncbi:MAG: hypothetical protein ABSG86_29275 [Thermoguttaceae bacterium]
MPFWLAYHCSQSSAVQSTRSIPAGSAVGVRFFFGCLDSVKPLGSGIVPAMSRYGGSSSTMYQPSRAWRSR